MSHRGLPGFQEREGRGSGGGGSEELDAAGSACQDPFNKMAWMHVLLYLFLSFFLSISSYVLVSFYNERITSCPPS